jgi:hypothetical protein
MKLTPLSARLGVAVVTAAAVSALAGLAYSQAPAAKPAAASKNAAPKAAAPAASAISIKVLSSRADMVSGGDALIEVKAPKGVKLSLNGTDVTSALKPNGKTMQGLINGLTVGANTLTATAGSAKATLKLTNYPITGPILSGPHMTPYQCETEESGLGRPLDADCSATTKVEYFYKSTAGGAYKPLANASDRPADVAMTTTIDGKTTPFVVKVESGTIDRTIYRIAMLADESAWNHRLSVTFGGGAGAKYNQGINQATGVLPDLFLSRGFAHIEATELVNGLHGNAVLQGEALMMIKEHFIEEHGVPKWTTGFGGSGGAIQQLEITQIDPGLLDGLMPSLTFPDSTLHTSDCGILQNYWKTDGGKSWSTDKKQVVEGFTPGTCGAWERSFVPVGKSNYKPGCDLKDQSLIFDVKTNPKGARCALADMRVNVYGRDPATGYARTAEDNVGVQYGLKALNEKTITVDEFLDLNAKIGGYDHDGNFVPARSSADPVALKTAYESGLLNGGGGGLANVPIIHYRTYNDPLGDIHSRERDLVVRARLIRANGDANNEVIWVSPTGQRPAPGQPAKAPAANTAALALDAMTTWLDAITADPAPLNHGKVVKHKPADAADAYFTEDGVKHVAKASWNGEATDSNGAYNTAYPVHGEPRQMAGAPMTNDVLKCQLKPIKAADYKASFSADQMAKMKAIFPGGVCDYAKKGVNQVALKGTYQKY